MFAEALPLLSELRQWLDQASKALRRSDETKERASSSVREAIVETRIYIGKIERSDDRNFDGEAKLAKIWATAAKDCRKLDPSASEECEKMSEYWASLLDSPAEDSDETGIVMRLILSSIKVTFQGLIVD
jgi:hypothetical protein